MKIRNITPFLACRDIETSLSFYTEILGFDEDWKWGEPATDAGVRKGDFSLFLMKNEELADRVSGSEISIGVDGVDRLFVFHKERNAPIISELEEKPWGVKEYSIKDPNGYILRFGE